MRNRLHVPRGDGDHRVCGLVRLDRQVDDALGPQSRQREASVAVGCRDTAVDGNPAAIRAQKRMGCRAVALHARLHRGQPGAQIPTERIVDRRDPHTGSRDRLPLQIDNAALHGLVGAQLDLDRMRGLAFAALNALESVTGRRRDEKAQAVLAVVGRTDGNREVSRLVGSGVRHLFPRDDASTLPVKPQKREPGRNGGPAVGQHHAAANRSHLDLVFIRRGGRCRLRVRRRDLHIAEVFRFPCFGGHVLENRHSASCRRSASGRRVLQAGNNSGKLESALLVGLNEVIVQVRQQNSRECPGRALFR